MWYQFCNKQSKGLWMEPAEIKCQIWFGKKMLATVTMLGFLLCGVERGFPEDFSSGFHGGKAGQGWWMGDDNLSGGTDDTALWSTSIGPSITKHNQSYVYLMLQIKNEIGYYIPIAEKSYADHPIRNSATPVSVFHLQQYSMSILCLVKIAKWSKMVNLPVHLGLFWVHLDPFGPFQAIIDF